METADCTDGRGFFEENTRSEMAMEETADRADLRGSGCGDVFVKLRTEWEICAPPAVDFGTHGPDVSAKRLLETKLAVKLRGVLLSLEAPSE